MSDTRAEVQSRRKPTEPEELYPLFEGRANAGDLEGLMELYEADATVVPLPGQAATGIEGIRAALGQLLAIGVKFRVEMKKSLRVGDIALLSGTWTGSAVGPGGNPMTLSGGDGVVARRQADGSWRMVIDDANFVE